jgi:hypothetical protein
VRGNKVIRSKVGFKVLGLCAMVLGLMSLGASAAQALPEWTYKNGSGLFNMGDLLPELKSSLESVRLLVTTKGGTVVSISCTAEEILNTKLKEGGKSTEGSIKFSGCTTQLNGVLSPKCEPFSGSEKGVINTKKLLYLLVLDAGVAAALVEPETGTTLAIIELGATCAVGEEVAVTGEEFLKDCNGEMQVHKVTHLLEDLLPGTISAFGVTASLIGSSNVSLKGTHAGLLWAGLAA